MTQPINTFININYIQNLIKDQTFDNIKNIVNEYAIEVRTIEEQPNLYLLVPYRAKTPLNENSQESILYKQLQLECNGLIFEKDTNKIVCMAQNKFNIVKNSSALPTLTGSEKFRIEYCEDGTVIRLYNYNGKWYTSTSKCIDARKSFWSSNKTFHDMFFEIFNESGNNIDELDVSFTYSFILIHKDNRIVVDHKYNNLIYINRISNITRQEDFTNYFYNDNPQRCIRRTKQIPDAQLGDLDTYECYDKRGLIIKLYNQEHNYQYDFNLYNKIKEVRGNVPLIRMRYLELLNEPEKLELLEKYYPEQNMVFTMIKHCINKLYKDIHNLYYHSHVKHSLTVEESHKFYRTLNQLHGQFKKKNIIVTLEVVIKKVNSLNPHIIKTLLGWVN